MPAWLRRWWGAIPAALVLALVWPEHGFVPIWDGRVYFDCVVDAARSGWSVSALRCGGHHSQLTMAWLALSQLGDPGNTTRLLLANVLLAWGALWAFHAILLVLWPSEERAVERALLTTTLAVHPLALASLVQLNSDYGVYVFLLMCLAFFWRDQRWLAAAAGLVLCFSKETGALVYAVLVATLVTERAVRVARADRARSDAVPKRASASVALGSLVQAARALAPAFAPLAVYAAFLAWWANTQASYVVWNQGMHERPLAGMRWFDLDDPIFRSYAAIIFVLGFAWVPTTAIVAALGQRLVAGWRRGRTSESAIVQAPSTTADGHRAILAILAVVLTYALTVYRTWSFPRYFLVLLPVLLICALMSLDALKTPTRVRRLLLASYALVLFGSVRASFDPVSRLLFGTWSLGRAEVYHVSRLSHDFRVRDADHLAYNLQFTGFHHALNVAFAALAPTESTTVVFPATNRWGLWSPLEAGSYRRVGGGAGTVRPRYADEVMVAALREQAPRELWLVQQPNDAASSALTVLHRRYVDAAAAQYSAQNVTIQLLHLVRREAQVIP